MHTDKCWLYHVLNPIDWLESFIVYTNPISTIMEPHQHHNTHGSEEGI